MGDFPEGFERALVEELARLSDNSMRDGQQSLDKNRVPGSHTVIAALAYEKFAQAYRQAADRIGLTETSLPCYEFWGGGQFGQPAQFLGENPFETLEAIAKVAPSIRIEALYRGRQGYGFVPIADDVQEAAIKESFKRGVRDLRVFDMMNEWQNIEKALTIARKVREEFPEKDIKIHGYVCYTKPAPDGKMAWEPEKEMAELAVKLAQAGVNAVEIKDYAGNLWSNDEAKQWMGDNWKKVSAAEVVRTIRQALDNAGFSNIPLNLHSHGQKPQALDEAMEAGATVVDVGIGVQSGRYEDSGKTVSNTLAHTNIRDVLELRMRRRGFEISDSKYAEHPVMQALSGVETAIARATEPVMDARRSQLEILSHVPEKQLRYHAMAGGAISALWGVVEKYWSQFKPKQMLESTVAADTIEKLKKEGLLPDRVNTGADITKEAHFLMALTLTEILWERGGTFATVTPGAKVCCEEAATAAIAMLQGKEVVPGREYADIIKGRFGGNAGLDKGIGDVALRTKLLAGAEPALYPPKTGSGLEAASKALDIIDGDRSVMYGKKAMPIRADATLLVALTTKDGKNEIGAALLRYLRTGERTGDIEPAKTPYTIAKTADELVTLAKVVGAIGEEGLKNIVRLTAIDGAFRKNDDMLKARKIDPTPLQTRARESVSRLLGELGAKLAGNSVDEKIAKELVVVLAGRTEVDLARETINLARFTPEASVAEAVPSRR